VALYPPTGVHTVTISTSAIFTRTPGLASERPDGDREFVCHSDHLSGCLCGRGNVVCRLGFYRLKDSDRQSRRKAMKKQDDDITIKLPRALYRRLKRAAIHEHCNCLVTGCDSADGHLDYLQCNIEGALDGWLEKEENKMIAAACPHGDQAAAEWEALAEASRLGARLHLA
jgi:hypothetical protein